MSNHDYKGAINSVSNLGVMLSEETTDAILHALSLADKLTVEPSEGMLREGRKNLWEKEIFKAMVKQAENEIEKE